MATWKKLGGVLALVVVVAVALVVLYLNAPPLSEGVPLPRDILGSAPRSIKVVSSAFGEGERIPSEFTCDASNVSPPISWEGVPKNAKSLVLVVYDPDAPGGTFIHWVLYDIKPDITSIPRAIPRKPVVPGLGLQAVNDFGYVGYGGPCPPRGSKPHRYVFLVLALDVESLGVKPGSPAREVLRAVKGHVLAYGYTYATYSR